MVTGPILDSLRHSIDRGDLDELCSSEDYADMETAFTRQFSA